MSKLRTVEIAGLKDLKEKLDSLGKEVGIKVLASAARSAMRPVLEDARSLVPVDEGELRDSIRIATVKPKGTDVVASAGIAIGARKIKEEIVEHEGGEVLGTFQRKVDAGWRWHFVEFGTSTQRARPFIRPAFDRNASKVIEILKKKLEQAIGRAAKKQSGGAK